MSRYLQMLKAEKRPPTEPTKPTISSTGNSVGFVGGSNVRFSKSAEAANDPANVPADCVGALQSDDGAPYLPWGPYLAPGDVQRMRAELVDSITQVSTLERWPQEIIDEVMAAAVRGPLSALAPDLAHYSARLSAARAGAAARGAISRASRPRS